MNVEHRDLLMVAASQRMHDVEQEADRASQFPAHDQRQDARHHELLQPAEIPAQNIDVAIGLFMREPQHILAKRFALSVLVGFQSEARVEIPADEQDALLRIGRSEEHTSELQSLMRISYAVFCLKKKKQPTNDDT